MIKRFIISLFICLNIIFSTIAVNATPIEIDENLFYDSNPIIISTKIVDEKRDLMQINARIPEVSFLNPNHDFVNDLNNEIIKKFNEKLAQAELLGAESIRFGYRESTNSYNISSIILTTTIATSTSGSERNDIDTFNIDTENQRLVHISDENVLGINGISIANKIIIDEINKTPEKYSKSFSGITNEQDFYLRNETVVLVFDKFEIASGTEGVVRFNIDTKQIRNFVLTNDDYYEKGSYRLRMLPLRPVCDAFDFEIAWQQETKSMSIVRNTENNSIFTSIKVDSNSYFKNTGSRYPLEVAPEIVDGITYAPISFFGEILSLDYQTDSDGNIIFSEYMQK